MSPFFEAISHISVRHRLDFSFRCVERCAFPYYSPGDFWYKKIVFYFPMFFGQPGVVIMLFEVEGFRMVVKSVFEICFHGSNVNFFFVDALV